jgi:hypothetical protein
MALTLYGELRNQLMRQSFPSVFAPAVLRDADSNYVPIPVSERLVQCIWYDQRLQPDELRTTDGRRVRVVFPGWWNLEAGPDFRHATVQIGDEPERTGDVELHLRADDWFHHGHQRDPLYDNVILHVVLWEAGSETRTQTRHGETLPQLVLQHQLVAPLESLYDEIDLDAYPHGAGNHAGRCAQVLAALPAESVGALLDDAGDERFAAKARKFSRWIHRIGPEQSFYEGWVEALGYKANKAAFRTLAQRLPISECRSALLGATGGESRPEGRSYKADLAAIFFGVANFLPTGAPRGRDVMAKRLWSRWWKLRPDFEDRILPAESWRFNGIRPANHPHRRLGAAVALLKKHGEKLMEKVVGAIESDGEPAKLFAEIRDDYWSYHFTLGGKTQTRASELIGEARAEEIVTNIVLPFVAAYAQDTSDDKLLKRSQRRFAALRAAPSNSIVRLAGHQLFGAGSSAGKFVKTARRQQGLMQVFQDFCLNDKSACHQCQFPELARRWFVAGSAKVS